MKVVIAEKPRMAQAIADALKVPRSTTRGVFENSEFCVVSCQGHIVTEYEPHDYDEALKRWSLESLPILPKDWKVKPIPGKERFLSTIKGVLKSATVVYAAGDPDAAGQRIVDEVLSYLGWNGMVLRPLISDLNSEPIRNAIQNAEPNDLDRFRGLYRKEVSRARGDWLLGMNLTRLYTLLGDKYGLNTLFSAGRVQSVTLGIIVKRDLEILNFKPHDYYSTKANIKTAHGDFVAKWAPAEDQEGLDSHGRLVSPRVAKKLIDIAPSGGTVIDFEEASGSERAPLLYSMSELQKQASKLYGLTMKQVLDTAQALYDKHELVTYPRSDNGYLPVTHHADATGVLATISTNLPGLGRIAERCNTSKMSRAFNDEKVTAHHAIIPTQKHAHNIKDRLTDFEYKVYDLICVRYLMQFMPDAQYSHRKVQIKDAQGELFIAISKVYTQLGWRVLVKDKSADDGQEDADATLPILSSGEDVKVSQIFANEKSTKPPEYYTDATLLDAMTNIHRHVEDMEVAKYLQEGEGVGTEATRADIIEKLVSHGLSHREAKKIKSTEEGRLHCRLMPDELTTPDMAGLFEYSIRKVESGSMTQSMFLDFISQFIVHQIDNSGEWIDNVIKSGVKPSGPKCRNCLNTLKKGRSKSTKAKLWVCKSCDSIYMDDTGMPSICVKGALRESDNEEKLARLNERMKNAPPCPNCQQPILREKSRNKKLYWACRSCDSLFSDFGGEIGSAFKLNGELLEAVADGPACTHCNTAMHRKMTKKSMPIFVCNNCDSMAWSNNGNLGVYFKVKGVMQKPRAGAVNKNEEAGG